MNEVCIRGRTESNPVHIHSYSYTDTSNNISFGGTNFCTNEAKLTSGSLGCDISYYLSLSLCVSFLLLPLWSIRHPWNALFHFSFIFLRQTVGLLGRVNSPSQVHYLTSTDRHACLEWDPNHDPSVRAEKTVRALDSAATVIGAVSH
jgi:hypothetical protein